MNFFVRVAAAFGALLFVAACAGPPMPAQLRTPESLAELLLNIRDATRAGLILDESFFREEQLKRSFGGESARVVRISMDSNTNVNATVTNFPSWGQSVRGEHAKLSLSAGWYRGFMAPDGKPRAGISLRDGALSDLTFEVVESLLGANWTELERPEYVPNYFHPAPPPQEATHRVGYATIRYDLADPRLERTLTISFNYDGTVRFLQTSANGYSRLFPR